MTKRPTYKIESETFETEVEQFYHDSYVGLSHQWLPIRETYYWVVSKSLPKAEGPFQSEQEAKIWARDAFTPCRDW